jgi:mRNA interferase MazF
MARGDLVTVAVAADCGRPRPAAIVQTDTLPATGDAVVVCQMTSDIQSATSSRVTAAPSEANGLPVVSQVMADKPVTARRGRIGPPIGRLAAGDIVHLNVALAFVVGLAD